MKMKIKRSIPVLLLGGLLCACSAMPQPEVSVVPQPTEVQETQMVVSNPTNVVPSPVPIEEIKQKSGEINALTEKLNLESTSEEIREKMLSSHLNWQTMEVQAVWENNSLNPDNSIGYTMAYEISTWIDQENLYFRTEEQQVDTDSQPKLAISDGVVQVIRESERILEGFPNVPANTYVSALFTGYAEEDVLDLLRSGEDIFPPMGEAYSGVINAELFPSAYAVQYPGAYEAMGLETIAGRETLKVYSDDMDRWGRSDNQHTLWIDTETGVILKAWTENIPAHFTSGMEIQTIAYNVPMDKAMFNIDEAIPDLKLSELESDKVEDIMIYAGNVQIVDEAAYLDVCFELPSKADWMLINMKVNGQEQMNISGNMIYLEPAGTFQGKGMRCDRWMLTSIRNNDTLTFEIGQLFAPAREGSACGAADKVSQALEEAGTPIEFTCAEDHGMILTEILSKPDTMTEEEARMMLDELFGQYRIEHIEGPWVFEIPLE